MRCLLSFFILLITIPSHAQNVGIGTTTPLDKLTVQSIPNSYGITHTDGTIKLSTFVGGSTGGGWIGTQSNHPFSFFTNNGSAIMTLTESGNVGIGNNSPVDKFNVTTGIGFGISHTVGAQSFSTYIDAVGVMVGSKNTAPFHLFVGSSGPTLTILANKFVGIGNTNPTEPLNLSTNFGYGFSHSAGGQAFATFIDPSGVFAGSKVNAPFHLYVGTNGPNMTILANGNIGIGTTVPTYKLSVNGNIRSKEVVVETGWADYVFGKEYRLLPLEELKQFIDQHKHLPNIPSAKEIEEKGLNVGDVQKRMMEKIEELTLYLLEANSQIRQLQIEMESLKKKNNK